MNYPIISSTVSWINNLFDGMDINLDPDWFDYGDPTLYFDMSFQARNNLFRNCDWLRLEPVPATAGNWLLRDNVFDRVTFLQDTNQPLDYDCNGNWPLSPTWLWWYGGNATLNPTTAENGAHDVLLSNPPPYQIGPFGNYYLSQATPLYQAGSQTAAAGLTNYTTLINQTKDAANQPVSIGLHYVAAQLSPLTAQQLDSDGDGIPDYVEGEHGTDPNNPMTDGVTPDAQSWVYDNIDLDGDGLTGAAERFFGTNPTNSDNPLNLSAVSQQSTLSGIVQIPLNIGGTVDTNTTFTLQVNGVAQNTMVYQTNGNWFAMWDTTAFANGAYQLSLEYDLDEDTPVFGATKFVNAQNAVCFPNNLPMCGSSLYVQPQTINTNGTYTMDVYDDQTNLFASMSGSVDGNGFCDDPNTGQPGITVSLQDTNGNQWPSESYTVQVTTYPAIVSLQSKSLFQPNQSGGGGAAGSTGTCHIFYSHPMIGQKWVVAFMPVYGAVDLNNPTYRAASELAEMMGAAVQTVVQSPYGSEGTVNDQNTTADGQAVLSMNDPNNPSPDDGWYWTQLIGFLNESGAHNFFYYGHAASEFIGMKYYHHLDSVAVADMLENNLSSGTQTLYGPQNHPYRFVFLDGCNTARGGLPMAFGIPNQVVPEDDWDSKYHLQPRAFLGWPWYTSWTLGTHGAIGMDETHMSFVENFFGLWSGQGSGQPPLNLGTALDQADQVPNYDPFSSNPYKPGPLSSSISRYGDPTLPFYQ